MARRGSRQDGQIQQGNHAWSDAAEAVPVWLGSARGTPARVFEFAQERGGHLKGTIASTGALAFCVAMMACTSTEPIRGPFSGAMYVLVQSDGQSLPLSLDDDTIVGTAHYSLVADTLQFDARQPVITGTVVERVDYIGTMSPPIFERMAYEYQYSLIGNAGTARAVCIPPGAPCAALGAAFFVAGDSLFLQHTPSVGFDTYLRIR